MSEEQNDGSGDPSAAPRAALVDHPAFGPLLVGLVALVASVIVSLLHSAVPQIHDEFGYALLADTFLEGRLANPPHPMWRHLDTIHVLQQPTYASKYPPLQGAVLAFGELVTGRAAFGVCVSFAIACALLVWMLRAWVGPRWAFVTGLLVALSGQIVVFWGTLFWGGALAMAGGALVYGAARRLVDERRSRDAVLLGAGLSVLALSRPFEGLVVALPALALVAWSRRRDLHRVVLGSAGPVAVGLGFLAYYNWRVTGSAVTLPYSVHSAAYSAVPEFLFAAPREEPTYSHPVLQYFYAQVAAQPYLQRQTWDGVVAALQFKGYMYWTFFPLHALTLALLVLPWRARDRWTAFLAASCLPLALALAVETYELPHYAAPGMCLMAALVATGLSRWWAIRPGALGKVVVVLLVAASLVEQALGARFHLGLRAVSPLNERPKIAAELQSMEGDDLVLVRYRPWHNPHHEWVYNAADVDGAPVVWARELDRRSNRQLLKHFAGRRVWVLDTDPSQPPQPMSAAEARAAAQEKPRLAPYVPPRRRRPR